eukprot:3506572-Pleurochrysis_carterae.AAC.1
MAVLGRKGVVISRPAVRSQSVAETSMRETLPVQTTLMPETFSFWCSLLRGDSLEDGFGGGELHPVRVDGGGREQRSRGRHARDSLKRQRRGAGHRVSSTKSPIFTRMLAMTLPSPLARSSAHCSHAIRLTAREVRRASNHNLRVLPV